MPNSAAPDSQPRSLRQLIGDRVILKPSVTERVALAQALASSLLFPVVECLGKSLRSDNVIFFPKSNGDIDYSEPIQCGFDYVQRREVTVREFYHLQIVYCKGALADIEGGEVAALASRSDLSRWCGNGQDISVRGSLLHYRRSITRSQAIRRCDTS